MDLDSGTPQHAYAVPFALHRQPASNEYVLTNVGSEPVDGVAFTLHGAGIMSASAPAQLNRGDSVAVTVVGRDLARSTILVVRWFRPDGTEYLWRVSF